MSIPATRAQVLSLYREFFRHGNKFASYNFRDYALRRSRDGFRANAAETDPAKIAQHIERAQQDLAVLKRQAAISSLYTTGEKLVIEKK
ncbi:hypothetical protein DFQ28_008775 [Apophysomyces sp. BC1034]|nr:hypothetical protein DFQ30_008214 [Apophysomyces sp. BC1015]KAG0182641.1 hypothetical protein DFQ29_002973 [Apophysomyces sp. BC1021]KAG0192537.1 hypothetical protein DFQ28_008775 [Apophysomyces sp. BC1034]